MSESAAVFLVDDDELFLAAQARTLRAARLQVWTFSSGGDLLSHVSPQSLGCVVTDLSLSDMTGLELQRELANRGVTLPVIFLTAYGTICASVCAMRAGAADFLEKRNAHRDLLDAIRDAVDRDATAHDERVKVDDLRRKFASLTPREREVVQQVLDGRLNKQIAATLGITTRTVKLHRTSIRAKVGIRSAVQLATLARDARLFDSGPSPSFPKGQ